MKAQAVGLFIYFPTSDQDSDFILNRDFMTGGSGNPSMDYFLLKTDGQPAAVTQVAATLTAQYKNVMPVCIQTTENVMQTETSSLTSLNLGGLGAMQLVYTVLVNERQREFGAISALGANLGHLRRFLFAEAATIGGLSLVIGAIVGLILASLLVILLGVIFTIPAHGLSIPALQLLGLAVVVILGMDLSAMLSARRLATLKVAETLREL